MPSASEYVSFLPFQSEKPHWIPKVVDISDDAKEES